jgi:hypothetical protein
VAPPRGKKEKEKKMAKYTITHSCGHSQTHELFGKTSDRERKIEWLKTTECADCWKAQQRAERNARPVTAEVIYNAFSGGVYLAVTDGDTYSIKDALKAAGCRWMEYHDNNDILGVKPPRKAWMIKINPENAEETAAIIQKLLDAGVQKINDNTLNPIGVAIAKRLERGD